MKGSASETYFRRMAEIEEQFYQYNTVRRTQSRDVISASGERCL